MRDDPIPAWIRVLSNPHASRRARRAAIRVGLRDLETMQEILTDEEGGT